MIRFFLLLFLFNGLILQASAVEDPAGEDAVHWLERMNHSVLTLSYEGCFVYLSGRSLEAMRIRHQIVDGEPRESLRSLNGVPREVIRDAHTLTIITQVNGREQRISQPSTEKFSPMKPLSTASLRRHYRMVLGEAARIADRYGRVVLLLPRDDLRYGYRLVLDQQSALPLDLTVLDGSGDLVSRIMLTNLTVAETGKPVGQGSEENAATAQTVSLQPAGGEEKIASPATQSAASVPADPEAGSRWNLQELPRGFVLVSHKHGEAGHQEHFVFSDGLATISAYLEPLSEGDEPFEGETSLGSINALGVSMEGEQLTVVGEVPHKTLRLIAGALKREE